MNLASAAAVSSLLRRHHFLPAHRFGQNFLVDGNTLAKIAAAGELEPGDTVLEIGTGLGVLTRALANAVGPTGAVISIERDRRLFPLHAETLDPAEYPHVRVIEGDALEVDLSDSALGLSQAPARPITVVANIPYNITSPLIARLLARRPRLRSIVLLVQKEVGDRLCAKPATSDYGAFSVFTQFYATVEMIGVVPPTVFYPSPKITSAIVQIKPRESTAVQVDDEENYLRIVRASFGQRRKVIANALTSEALGWSRAKAEASLAAAGIEPQRRGETLSIAEFAALERASTTIDV
jgi:16S rRNA (adenine1518-N6/adenine1519-N6)-dimethyltransferase